jgi:hypothetical protein
MNPVDIVTAIWAAGLVMWLLMMLFLATFFGLFIGALVHCLKYKHDKDRLTWVIVVIAVPLIGPILYFTIGRAPAPGQAKPAFVPVSGPPRAQEYPMDDEKKRAAAINESLRAMSASRRSQTP